MSIYEFYTDHRRAIRTAGLSLGAAFTLTATALIGANAYEYHQTGTEISGKALAYDEMNNRGQAKALRADAAEYLELRNKALLITGGLALGTVLIAGYARSEFNATDPANYSIYSSESYINQQDC